MELKEYFNVRVRSCSIGENGFITNSFLFVFVIAGHFHEFKIFLPVVTGSWGSSFSVCVSTAFHPLDKVSPSPCVLLL